jgi:CMP-N-acetylneuraminic acid synthetase
LYKNKKILAIIPARTGSKRIKNKNLKKINNKPLIYYTLKYALGNIKLIDEIFVSTDSRKILNYAKKIIPNTANILRPKKISKDNSSDYEYINHVIKFLEKKNKIFDIIIILRPTTPIRDKKLIINCLKILINGNASSVRSAKCVEHTHPYWMYKLKKNIPKEIIKNKNFFKYYQSQKLPKFFMHDGHCDIFLKKNIFKRNEKNKIKKIYGNKMLYFKNMQKYSVNIDEPFDFYLTEQILKKLSE